MATDENERKNHDEWQPQEDSQADGVEDALLVLGQDDVPDRGEEGDDSLHGAGLCEAHYQVTR